MKMYLKPEIETVEVKTADLVMGLAGSPEHSETSNAPEREKKLF